MCPERRFGPGGRDHREPGPWSLAHRYRLTDKGYRALGVPAPRPDPAGPLTLGEFYRRGLDR